MRTETETDGAIGGFCEVIEKLSPTHGGASAGNIAQIERVLVVVTLPSLQSLRRRALQAFVGAFE